MATVTEGVGEGKHNVHRLPAMGEPCPTHLPWIGRDTVLMEDTAERTGLEGLSCVPGWLTSDDWDDLQEPPGYLQLDEPKAAFLTCVSPSSNKGAATQT